jgi:carbon-monoxide dehydrogenase small subunit
MSTPVAIRMTVNGQPHTATVPPRLLLVDFLRDRLGLTGTHVGCEHGVCGACTVLVDGASARACLMLAAQADGAAITTVEGLAENGMPHPLQRAFDERFALQCGFCTPGMILAALELLRHDPQPSDDAIRAALAGNICRCTGYQPIVDAVRAAGAGARR